ncbi:MULTISPECIES: HIT domain-containing protein [Pseudomonas]|uniref:Diadenosine tetraphosphate (Ap4A) hydrolase n=1 Tax=Pseudomonas oryzihabitans TaxID=47885 RepID=A0A1G5P5A2_9PSED|nr:MULTISPECIES: HIT family protein [Pseudomonas]KIZ49624.1 diadenosine tetraphosphate hydrolase [Pseudomonas oryzihabitans]NMY91403.1 HIT family protein [Pseudomonas psychrotolerans]NMZ45891.1 HIT family protein [Pseudomonas oryzihabitans]OYT83778.1 MAG: HIT family protein [Pseudomonas sp. PGPPP4]SCZ44706.1 Diadenosine tetraphosphate (Ap4A) hydrolase [Pseudomonas psychrotolerans]
MFQIDPRLAGDTLEVASLTLCQVLLLNDRRYDWLVLVPRRESVTEILDLSPQDQAQLWREVTLVAQVLRHAQPDLKLNIGALGNVVRQLHLHVLLRQEGDPAWPGPVWGHSPREPHTAEAGHAAAERWRVLLAEETQA